ncbi:hypothetical protein M569_02235, partial [Genlisea aurea]
VELPPESFWLSKDAEYDWFDRFAIYERKNSTRRSSISNPNHPLANPGFGSSSQRVSFALKSKPSIIGLPKKANLKKKAVSKSASNARSLFPNQRSGSVGKSSTISEPVSPKVSCIGKVRSRRDRRRRSKREETASAAAAAAAEKKGGLYGKILSIFRS